MSHLFDFVGGPLYGLSANVAPPPLGAILSLLMIFGADWTGLMVLDRLRLGDFVRWPWLRWQAIPTGAAVLAVLLFPFALSGALPRPALQPLALALAVAGAAHGWRAIARFEWRSALAGAGLLVGKGQLDILDVLFWASLLGLGLLALAPTTDADALDYHVGVALSILNTGAFPFAPAWFTSRLAGSGEVLIAMGLSIGAEQFGSLLQYSGVLGVAGIFRHGFALRDREHPSSMDVWRKIVSLAVISTPVFIAWVASPKPMLLPVGMTTAALVLALSIIGDEKQRITSARRQSAFALVCLLVMVAAVSKMNFLLSGAIVGAIALAAMARHHQARFALACGIAAALLIIAPPMVWKHLQFGGAMIDALLTPFPGHWPGTKEFEAMLRAYRDTNVTFPVSLVIPSGSGTITTVLGLGVFLAIFALWRPQAGTVMKLLAASAGVAVLGAILGQRNARFFLEPYVWLLLATLLQRGPLVGRGLKWISVAVTCQGIAALVLTVVGVATLTSGSLTPALRERTMRGHAYGYSIMKWADGVLPDDARFIVDSRSVALAPRYAIANDWRAYVVPGSAGAIIYAEAVRIQRPGFILLSTAVGQHPVPVGCHLAVHAGPFHAELATRNPFNAGAAYDAWILRVDPAALCP